MSDKKITKIGFKDFEVHVKLKLSALWASVTLCYLYGDYFELYVPKKVEGLLTGDNLLDSPVNLFIATFVLAIPALMVILSLLLKPFLNRLLNIIFGLFFTAVMLMIAFSSALPWRSFYLFLAIVESVITALIVWYAATWPKQK